MLRFLRHRIRPAAKAALVFCLLCSGILGCVFIPDPYHSRFGTDTEPVPSTAQTQKRWGKMGLKTRTCDFKGNRFV